jgi:hypothetical protein
MDRRVTQLKAGHFIMDTTKAALLVEATDAAKGIAQVLDLGSTMVRPFVGLTNSLSPIATLAIKGAVRGLNRSECSEAVYGGYANAHGGVVLFSKDLAYGVNFKHQILKQRPPLNVGAQARYDATEPGEDFEYGGKTFRRLSREQIMDICTAGHFRVGSRF